MDGLIPSFIVQKLSENALSGTFQAAVVFVDLSGFTALTNTLTKQGNTGAEQLSNILNTIFEPTVAAVYANDGFIPHFAGDAFTAIFEKKEADKHLLQAVEAAHQCLQYFESKNSIFDGFTVSIKAGIAFGYVEWGIIGAEEKTYYFEGAPIDDAATAQSKSTALQLIGHPSFLSAFAKYFLPADLEAEFSTIPYRKYGSTDVNLRDSSEALPPTIYRQFLPDALTYALPTGEFRRVVSVFLAFEGAAKEGLLDHWVSLVLKEVVRYGGYFKEVDFGDKGGVIVCFFGAPTALEANGDNALLCLQQIRKQQSSSTSSCSAITWKAGVTEGIAFTGMLGGKARAQYCIVGSYVNLAARLMAGAPWDHIHTDQSIATLRKFSFTDLGERKFKGFDQQQAVFEFQGVNLQVERKLTKFVNRRKELDRLIAYTEQQLSKKQGAIITISGAAGVGKTRLFNVFFRKIDRQRFTYLKGKSELIQKNQFHALRLAFRRWLGDQSVPSAIISLYGDSGELSKELERLIPIYEAIAGKAIVPHIWFQMDPSTRYRNEERAFLIWLQALSQQQATLLFVDNHLLADEGTLAVIEKVKPLLSQKPFVIVLASRIGETLLNVDDHSHPNLHISLKGLQKKEMKTMAEAWLEGPLEEHLLNQMVSTTNGIPFYIEQWLQYLKDQALLLRNDNGVWDAVSIGNAIPDNLHGILTAQVDSLPEEEKSFLKIASIIGHEFDVAVLNDVIQKNSTPTQGGITIPQLREKLENLSLNAILEHEGAHKYRFQHSMLRDATYQMQLPSLKQRLHRLVAQSLHTHAATIEDGHLLTELAHHYEQGEQNKEAAHYTWQAAEWARDNYQNRQALRLFDKSISLTDERQEDKKAKALLEKGRILEHTGQWTQAMEASSQALEIGIRFPFSSIQAEAQLLTGKIHMLQGHYAEAMPFVESAIETFLAIEDVEGQIEANGDLGNLYFRQGKYENAKQQLYRTVALDEAYMEQEKRASALEPQVIANLGLVLMNQGEIDSGIHVLERYLERAEQEDILANQGILHTNLGILQFEKGNFLKAKHHNEAGLQLSEKLGNLQGMSIAMGCLGTVYQELGDFAKAQSLLEEDIKLCEQMGDLQGIAIAHGLMGELLAVIGDGEHAIPHLEIQQKIARQIGYKKGEAKAINTLGDIAFFKKNYAEAEQLFAKAIEIAASIGNKLVLASFQLELAEVQIARNNENGASITLETVQPILKELGNPSLSFQYHRLSTLIAIHTKIETNIKNQMETLTSMIEENNQAAEVDFLMYLWKQEEKSKRSAFAKFQKLYTEKPKAIYLYRMKLLDTI